MDEGMTKKARKSLPVTRMAVEAVLIVVSILLAFGIDAWWDDRKLAIEEAELIVALEKEFLRNRQTLLEQENIHAQILEMVGQLVLASRQGGWSDDSRTIDDALYALTYPGTTDLEGGVLDALVSASRFDIISDLELRTKLAGWGAIFAEVQDDEQNNRRLVFDRVIPYLFRQHVPLSRRYSYGEADELILTRSLADDESALSRTLNDPEFMTLCEIRYSFLSHTTGEYQQALDAIDAILAALERAQRRR
jgi:hypothetical protein